MRKFFSLIAAVLFAGSMMADPIVINASDVTTIASGATSGLDVTLQGINIVWQGAYYNSDGGDGGSASVDFRVYANKSMTLTAESNISKVEIAGYCKAGLTVTANAGTITTGASYASETTKGTLEDPLIVVDEIGATSVTLTCTKQMRAYTLRITLDGGVTPPAVATPVISGDETFTESVVVTITCSTPEADIYYTTDGTTNPTCDCPAAPEYTQQIVLTETTTIMAAAYTGNDWSAVATKTFTKVEPLADPTNCAEAAEAALSVSENNEEYNNGKEYTIEGYVTSIQTAYSAQYNNVSFWMADTKDGGKVLEAYRAVCATAADAPNEGDKVAVTGKLTKYNTTPEFAAGCTFTILERAEVVPAENLGEKTIEEFLALKNTKDTCILTGVVKNIQNTTYGNFDLEDETGSVYVYGLLTAAGEAQKFAEMGIEEYDILTIKAVYSEYNGNPQAKNAIFVSVEKGEKPEPQTIELDVVYGEVALYATQGIWQINLYKDYDSETQTVTYPDLYIGVTPKSATTIAGIYSIEEEIAFVEVDVASEQTVTATEATDLEVVCLGDGVYSFYMEFVGDDGNTYVLDAEVPVLAYNAESEEGEEIELEDNPETGVETTKVADKAVKFIENATLIIERNGVRYNVMGQVVR